MRPDSYAANTKNAAALLYILSARTRRALSYSSHSCDIIQIFSDVDPRLLNLPYYTRSRVAGSSFILLKFPHFCSETRATAAKQPPPRRHSAHRNPSFQRKLESISRNLCVRLLLRCGTLPSLPSQPDVQVSPFRIHCIYQVYFPGPLPSLNICFALNRFRHCGVKLIPHQYFYVISFCETLTYTFPVLPDTLQ